MNYNENMTHFNNTQCVRWTMTVERRYRNSCAWQSTWLSGA